MSNLPLVLHKTSLILGILLLLGITSVVANDADNRKQVDSILKASVKIIYEDPNAAIATGKEIYEEKSNALDLRIEGLQLISTAYSSKRDYQQALQYALQAYELVQDTDYDVLKIQILTRLGGMYEQLKVYDKAIEYLETSEKLCLAYPYPDSVRFTLASNYFIKGFIYKERLNCEIAVDFFKKGIAQYTSFTKERTLANASIAQYNLGNCYIMLNDYEQAEKSFEASIHNAILAKAYSLQAFSQKGLAEVYTLQGKYQLAIMLLTQAQEVSRNVGDLVLNLGIYKGLSENYLALNDWDSYKTYHIKYQETQLLVKQSERKSVDDSLQQYTQDTDVAMDKLQSNFSAIFKIAVAIVVVAFILTFFKLRANKKQLAVLKERLDTLQKQKMPIS